ncbi:hypothetical protein ANN_05244 [Periplaneta americana]|uniref:Uncharacterized protein n=1 Tax=Periplaneta americana TaxID=6978 RepID=A0ABQ8TBV4_PERAM|nr:hypothetical protein ANN_05244 [Periplaneta americana]
MHSSSNSSSSSSGGGSSDSGSSSSSSSSNSSSGGGGGGGNDSSSSSSSNSGGSSGSGNNSSSNSNSSNSSSNSSSSNSNSSSSNSSNSSSNSSSSSNSNSSSSSSTNCSSDNAGEMSPGSSTESYPAFARIGLRENPGKTSTSGSLESITRVLESIQYMRIDLKSKHFKDRFETPAYHRDKVLVAFRAEAALERKLRIILSPADFLLSRLQSGKPVLQNIPEAGDARRGLAYGQEEIACSKPGYAANLSVVSRCGFGNEVSTIARNRSQTWTIMPPSREKVRPKGWTLDEYTKRSLHFRVE